MSRIGITKVLNDAEVMFDAEIQVHVGGRKEGCKLPVVLGLVLLFLFVPLTGPVSSQALGHDEKLIGEAHVLCALTSQMHIAFLYYEIVSYII